MAKLAWTGRLERGTASARVRAAVRLSRPPSSAPGGALAHRRASRLHADIGAPRRSAGPAERARTARRLVRQLPVPRLAWQHLRALDLDDDHEHLVGGLGARGERAALARAARPA